MAVATDREYSLFINGESTESSSGELRELIEPATGAPLARVAVANEQDVDRAVDAARAALESDLGKTPPTKRSRLLHALADALVANRKELAELEARNVGKAGDPARGHRLARRIKAGTVGINMPCTAFPGIPFGGYKQSGFGRELGLETLDAYLETKSVIVSTSPKPFNPFGL